ncbi:phasin family protein [Teredinibacter sp. KSP-S5-2]|uniref:phasin family protein n=1 Tax=Teredinibacter sp. KSP-S5-2 TaxID=3034506 RepID=UPI0029342218|nr:phasin family protein [Teredinibacter sp. KSP-S5-2]WNO07507.1 phasin family protein [Teredinibacter sp. KSP-S5-2]
MFDKFIEQSQNAFKPVNELVALNTKVFEEVAEKQKSFFNDMVNDGLLFAKELSAQKDFTGVYQAQKSYWEKVQDKVVTASTDAYEVMARTQESVADVIKGAADGAAPAKKPTNKAS